MPDRTGRGVSFREHICTVCFEVVSEHDEECSVEGCQGHWPPLCCPECGCESFEEAHPAGEGE